MSEEVNYVLIALAVLLVLIGASILYYGVIIWVAAYAIKWVMAV